MVKGNHLTKCSCAKKKEKKKVCLRRHFFMIHACNSHATVLVMFATNKIPLTSCSFALGGDTNLRQIKPKGFNIHMTKMRNSACDLNKIDLLPVI